MEPLAVLRLALLLQAIAAMQPVHQPFDVYWDMYVPGTQMQSPTTKFTHDRRYTFESRTVVKLGLRGSNWIANPHAWGLWPKLDASNKVPARRIVNGGVPQAGNLSLHLATIRASYSTPWPRGCTPVTPGCLPHSSDLGTDGMGRHPVDWDGFIYVENGEMAPHNPKPAYVARSIALVRAKHPTWPAAKLEAQALEDFASAMDEWMAATLRLYQALRPQARIGYWAMPDPGKKHVAAQA